MIFVLCCCVHIAYVSIWCPVDIVVLNLDFSDLCRFYIYMWAGREEQREGVRDVCLFHWLFIGRSIHSRPSRYKKKNADVQNSSEDEMVFNFDKSIFIQLVLSIFAIF